MQDLGAAGSDVIGDQHLFDHGAAIHKFAIPETGMPMFFTISESEDDANDPPDRCQSKTSGPASLEPRSRVIERRKSCSEDYR